MTKQYDSIELAPLMICANCKWWNNSDSEERQGRGVCELGNSKDGEPTAKETSAIAFDAEGYEAWLETTPDFGCIQFLERKIEK